MALYLLPLSTPLFQAPVPTTHGPSCLPSLPISLSEMFNNYNRFCALPLFSLISFVGKTLILFGSKSLPISALATQLLWLGDHTGEPWRSILGPFPFSTPVHSLANPVPPAP